MTQPINSQLNPPQREAARYIDGPLLVLAGAGSGKTRVITHKIAYLIQQCGYKASNIIAVTFTNKAAREMKSRVGEMLSGKESRGLIVSTFHTLGLRILRKEYALVNLRPGFSIFDSQDTLSLLRDIMQRDLNEDIDMIKQIQWQISHWKNALISPEQAFAQVDNEQERIAAAVYQSYVRHLSTYNAVDFDDLIYLPVDIFLQHPHRLAFWQNKIHHLLVDEYQDTNNCQYLLVKQLVAQRLALTAVGDDDQSIYAWRGAQAENLARLSQDFPTLKLIKLEQNYRSTGRILKAANQLIANNPHEFEKILWSQLGYGDPIRVIACRDEEHEAQRVVTEILSHKFKHRTAFRDYAILYRGNYQSRLLERHLREQRIPYFLSGGTSFFERSEIKDILAYLRLLANPDDDAALLRVINTPKREIGVNTIEKLANYAQQRQTTLLQASMELGLAEHLSPRALKNLQHFTRWIANLSESARGGDIMSVVDNLIRETDYEDWLKNTSNNDKAAERRMENVNELRRWIKRLLDEKEDIQSLGDIVAHMTLIDILERQDEENVDDRAYLMTLHSAKGLEFPHVFIIGMEEELLPHRSSIEEEKIDEERRLAYVGVTRAQQNLTFTYASKRQKYGETIECEPSRFLSELPADDIEWEGKTAEVDPEKSKQRGQAHLANLRQLLN